MIRKLRIRLQDWVIMKFVCPVTGEVYKHTHFVDDTAYKITVKICGEFWVYAWGEKKPEIPTVKSKRKEWIDTLGGMSWERWHDEVFILRYCKGIA